MQFCYLKFRKFPKAPAPLLQATAQQQFHASVDIDLVFTSWGNAQENFGSTGACVPVYAMASQDMEETIQQKLIMYERENKELGLDGDQHMIGILIFRT